MKLVWKLLRQHISIPQFVGFFLANLIGLTIILLGIQFYKDINAVYNSEDSLMKDDYLIVNKKVSTISTITGGDNTFSNDELEDIKSQPFIKKFGVFTPSTFKVSAGFDIEGLAHFSTDMFFESVPDEFVDVEKDRWTFHESDVTIPIVIPKSYLDLYNFGFAQSQNMPTLSEGVLEAINIDVRIRGNDDDEYFKGAIAGFSNRLNTILVPEDFMTYANKKFASEREVGVSRLVLQVDNPTDDRITSYLQDNNLETDEDKLDASKTNYLLKLLVTIVLVIGAIICILALFILMLSVYLLVEKNTTKLENLLLIGYSPAKVALPYQLLTIILNLCVTAIAILLVFIIRKHYINMLENFFPDMTSPSTIITYIFAILILAFVSFINYYAIRHKVYSIWHRKR